MGDSALSFGIVFGHAVWIHPCIGSSPDSEAKRRGCSNGAHAIRSWHDTALALAFVLGRLGHDGR